jgi:hypothetical protein
MDIRDAKALCKAIRNKNGFVPSEEQNKNISVVEEKIRNGIGFFRFYEQSRLEAIYREAFR